MDILDLLDDRNSKPLISYRDITLTKSDFVDLVEFQYEVIAGDDRLKTEQFIILNEDHPFRFYPLLFALLKNGNNVCFPNRDYLNGSAHFSFCTYSISIADDKLVLNEEPGGASIKLPEEGAMVVFSSGSTGKPKGILHSRISMIGNAHSVLKKIGIRESTSLTPLKPYLVSAFSHFLVHCLSNSHLIFVDFRDDSQVSKWYDRYNDISIVGSPMHIMTVAHSIPSGKTPEFFFSSGDFMYPINIKKILEKYPDSQYFNVYGLAEIGGRFFINPVKLSMDYNLYNSIGDNIEGTSYEVINDQLFVNSEFQFLGYIIDNDFLPSQSNHPTGDKVIKKNGVLTLYGRVDDEIKIGGNKISLKHIEGRINNLFEDTCVVFDTTHPRLGTLFAMAIYTEKDYKRGDIIDKLKSHLEPHEIPHYYYYLKEMYYTQTMKIDRKEIKERIKELSPIR